VVVLLVVVVFVENVRRIERSTDQVIKPINLEALNKWVSSVPEDVKPKMRKLAPMLAKLGVLY